MNGNKRGYRSKFSMRSSWDSTEFVSPIQTLFQWHSRHSGKPRRDIAQLGHTWGNVISLHVT